MSCKCYFRLQIYETMERGILSILPPWRKLLITLGIALICSALFWILSLVCIYFLFDVNVLSDRTVLNNFSDKNVLNALKFVQAFGGGIGMFIVPAFICAFLFSNNIIKFLGLEKIKNPTTVITIILLSLTSIPLINCLVEFNSHLSLPSFLKPVEQWMKDSETQIALLTEAFVKITSLKDLLINLVVIALLPAIGEELIFRGIGQKLITDWAKNKHAGIWISAALFSAIHMQFFGFLPRMMLGVYFGYMLLWTQNIWFPVLAHFINNAAAIVFAFLLERNSTSINPDEIGTQKGETSIIVLSVALTGGLLYHLYKTGKGVPKDASINNSIT